MLKKIRIAAKVKDRHVLTKDNRVRIRFVLTPVLVLFMGVVGVLFSSHSSNALNGVTAAGGLGVSAQLARGEENSHLNNAVLIQSRVAPEIGDPRPLNRELEIKPGDALSVVMQREGVGHSVFTKMMQAMKSHYDPRYVKVGQKIVLDFEQLGDGSQAVKEMRMPLSPIKTLVVARADDSFSAKIDEKPVKKVIRARKAEVKVSLYGSAAQVGIPKGIVADAIRIYSWNVDFQRDIRPKDTLEVMYESYETADGHVVDEGNILYASLTLSGKTTPLYRFEMANGRVDYFQRNGISIKRTLMKTPVNGARVSSGYGMRRHPILGYSKMHKGIDFAALTGTPIFAAGDGVVERAGRNGGYGNYVRIRHNSKLKTAYAHLHKIKPAVKNGARVKQGQVIGTVGTTGRSTGPHLHYEVLVHGKQVNPRSVDLPIGEELIGEQKQAFLSAVNDVDRLYVASLEKEEDEFSGLRKLASFKF